jgi:hypothetical protein
VTDLYEVPPERLRAWLERWADAHGGGVRTETRPGRVTFTAADGETVVCEPPFPPMNAERGVVERFELGPLLAHVGRDRVVGVLLVRLGGHAAGVFSGRRLVESKTGVRPVHGRISAGGQSQKRYERRRDAQVDVALDAAADVAAQILVPHVNDLEFVVPGGDRRALATVLEDKRLRLIRRLTTERVLDVPDPRPAVLRGTPDRFLATIVRPSSDAS